MEARGTVDEVEGTAVAPATGLPAFGHRPFSGTYRTKLEANGRLVLPSALRGPFVSTGAAHVLPRKNQTLWLLTELAFEQLVDFQFDRQPGGLLDPQTRARAFKATPSVSVDKQARLVLPAAPRERLGLTGEVEVVLAGAIERVELWPAALFDETEAASIDNDVDLMFEGHEGLPTKRL